MDSIIRPIQPTKGLRNTDAYGSGVFGAARDGGVRVHLGRDYIALPGDAVVSPVDGKVQRVIKAYSDAELAGLEIISPRARIKLLYFLPNAEAGQVIARGEIIGIAQNVAEYWHAKEPRAGRMVNHIHLELMVIVDPESHLER